MSKIVAIVGRTNVGKSTLFNRIIKKRFAVTSFNPQTTRDRLYAETVWRGEEFSLVDTAGLNIEIPKETPKNVKKILASITFQVHEAIKEADVLMFVLDVGAGITFEDKEIANILRKSQKPIFLVANKVDNSKRERKIEEFLSLGMGEAIPVSAISGRRTGDLLDKLLEVLKKVKPQKERRRADINISIIGRPNVGKSTLLNKFAGEERVLVSEIPGTTIDTVDIFLRYQEKMLKLVDTAGIRRRGKIKFGIEKFSVLRAIKTIGRSDVVLLLIDSLEGITNQDLHIAQFVLEAGKGLILVLNKWDLVEGRKSQEEFLGYLRGKIRFLPWVPVVFISALTGKNIKKTLDLSLEIFDKRRQKISTRALNNLISEALIENPLKPKGRLRPKVYFSTQSKTAPPTFSLKVNDSTLFHFSYLRYLERKLRENFDFTGTPIKIELRSNR